MNMIVNRIDIMGMMFNLMMMTIYGMINVINIMIMMRKIQMVK